MGETRWGQDLRPENLPGPDADWMQIAEFALTFEGYGYAGSLHPDESPTSAAHRLYEEVCEALTEGGKATADLTLEDLRCALFYHQRMVRWSEPEVVPLGVDASGQADSLCDSATELGREIIQCIREKLETTGESC